MTRRHPDHALISNPQDTAPPRGRRHPRETSSSNHHGTAPPTRHAQQQSPWHSGTQATRPAAIPMAQRRTRRTCDTPDAHRHSLPLRSTAQRRTPDTPDAACRCVPRNVRSKLTSAKPRIPCACHDFATPHWKVEGHRKQGAYENALCGSNKVRLAQGNPEPRLASDEVVA